MSWSLLWLVGPALFGLATPCGEDMNKYLVKRGGKEELRETLTLQEEQGGIAGVNVYRWKIGPSGNWTYTEYQMVGGKERPGSRHARKGRLDEKDLRTLAKQLESSDLAGLPPEVGKESSVNPHRYVLSFGKETESRIVGAPPRTDDDLKKNILSALANDDSAGGALSRFAAIAQTVQDVTTRR
jgi:hypothetical protein